MPDKFTAVWVSHSSSSDFLNCPRAYYLKNIYKDPTTGHKISLTNPALALGQSVHNVLESLSSLPSDKRFERSLQELFDEEWKKVSGKMGGFVDETSEYKYKKRGKDMLERVYKNPGVLKNLAVKMNQDLPHYWLSEEENIILCGKIDWLEYFKETDSVHILDFKTGKNNEKEDSLQLPIYLLLVSNCQERKVDKASYWYLERSDVAEEVKLPEIEEARERVLDVAKKMKLARQLKKFDCPNGADGCFSCKPMEKIIKGEAEKVGADQYNRDVYIVKGDEDKGSVIL